MGRWVWADVAAVGANTAAAFLSLDGVSRAIILSVLSEAQDIYHWQGAGDELTSAEIDEISAALASAELEIMVGLGIGAVLPYLGDTAPAWGLLCQGQTLDKADYPELWDVLPASIKDETSFTLPDLRGRVLLGTGQGTGLSNYAHLAEGGEEAHQLSESELASHTHSYYPPVLNLDLEAPGAPDILGAGISLTTSPTGATGGDQAHENRQPYTAVNYAIITGR